MLHARKFSIRSPLRDNNGTDRIASFPRTKKFLAGYWIVNVESAARGYAIAAQVSAAPGPGGQPLEVGEVMQSVRRAL